MSSLEYFRQIITEEDYCQCEKDLPKQVVVRECGGPGKSVYGSCLKRLVTGEPEEISRLTFENFAL